MVRTMSVKVKFIGPLIKLTGCQSIDIQLNHLPQPTILSVLQYLSKKFGKSFEDRILDYDADEPRLRVLILKNDVEIHALEGLKTQLNPRDKVVIIPVSHGG